MGWIIAVCYVAVSVIAGLFLRRSGDSLFEGDNVTDYVFNGFVSLFWVIFVPIFAIGKVISLLERWLVRNKREALKPGDSLQQVGE